MTKEKIKAVLAKMEEVKDDTEYVHGLQDGLWEDVLEYIAGCEDILSLMEVPELARLALQAGEIGGRWYA